MPPLVKKRGRPKGHGLTTIGLPAKRARKEYKKPCSFSKLHVSEKEKVILSWFVDEKVAERALKHNYLIEEEDVECKPELLPDSVLDENVDIHLPENTSRLMLGCWFRRSSSRNPLAWPGSVILVTTIFILNSLLHVIHAYFGFISNVLD